MANVKTDALPSVATIAVGDTFVGNDASSGDTAQFTLPAFDARYAQLAGANTFSGTNAFQNNLTLTSAASLGLVWGGNSAFTQAGDETYVFSRGPGGAQRFVIASGTASLEGSGQYGFSSGGATGANDTALSRAAAGVFEVNDGTPGTGHGKAINFPRTAADADAPAPASGATLYSKVVGGKNALFARFPTGAVQQIAIEP